MSNVLARPVHIPGLLLRRLTLLILDAGLILLSFWLAFALRLNDPLAPLFARNLYLAVWAVVLGLPLFLLSGWYRGLTRYSGSHSLYSFLPRSGLLVLLLLLVSTLSGNPTPPFRGFWIFYWVLLSGTAICSRIVLRDLLRYRLARQVDFETGSPSMPPGDESPSWRVPTLIYGANQAAHQLLTELRHHPRFRICAVVDDDPDLWGRRIEHLSIHAPPDLPELISGHSIRQVLLANPSASRSQRRQLVEQLSSLGLVVFTIPSLASIASGDQAVSDLRPVAIEDLLGREPSQPDPELIVASVAGKVVMVTGAGGSIGSELCRQILHCRAAGLVLLERNEFALYTLEQELEASRARISDAPALLLPVLGDAADQPRLEALCRQHGVQVLFHAAAYKHVPLVERNPCVGVANNVNSTRATLGAAIACGLERFMLISSDKAVRPTNAMGASKRICELIVQDAAARLAGSTGPVVSMVRFGNVLGSSGSVIPRFTSQISNGGPLTVTDPEITRYFMTIPEAVQLVLQANGFADGGEVFVLDMGEPVKILDLARQMIRLSGCTICDEENPDGEIAIAFTGLRPGEKLYEELLIQESDYPTKHPLIRKAHEDFLPPDQLERMLHELDLSLQQWDNQRLFVALKALVSGYRPLDID